MVDADVSLQNVAADDHLHTRIGSFVENLPYAHNLVTKYSFLPFYNHSEEEHTTAHSASADRHKIDYYTYAYPSSSSLADDKSMTLANC